MGNGMCCKKVERVETLEVDSSPPQQTLNYEPQPMVSLSDSGEDDYKPDQKKFGVFKEVHKNSQLSTGQQYSFQSLPSEQHFSNFVTFQALPSQQGINSNCFSNFQKEMNDFANQQQKTKKNPKKK